MAWFGLGFSIVSLAQIGPESRYESDIKALSTKAEKSSAQFKADIKELENQHREIKPEIRESLNDFLGIEKEHKVHNLEASQRSADKKPYEIVAFVSTSMPLKALVRMGLDMKKFNGSMALRGLIKNSFKETAAFLVPYIEQVGSGMNIDPEPFKTFNITQVPCIVIAVDDKNFDKVCGHVTVDYALQLSKEKGVLKSLNLEESKK